MSETRIKAIRFFALLVMVLGVLCIPVVLYYGVPSMVAGAQNLDLSFDARKHGMRAGMLKLMGGLLLCQVMIGGGGFVRWKCKKLLAAKTPPTSASI